MLLFLLLIWITVSLIQLHTLQFQLQTTSFQVHHFGYKSFCELVMFLHYNDNLLNATQLQWINFTRTHCNHFVQKRNKLKLGLANIVICFMVYYFAKNFLVLFSFVLVIDRCANNENAFDAFRKYNLSVKTEQSNVNRRHFSIQLFTQQTVAQSIYIEVKSELCFDK